MALAWCSEHIRIVDLSALVFSITRFQSLDQTEGHFGLGWYLRGIQIDFTAKTYGNTIRVDCLHASKAPAWCSSMGLARQCEGSLAILDA